MGEVTEQDRQDSRAALAIIDECVQYGSLEEATALSLQAMLHPRVSRAIATARAEGIAQHLVRDGWGCLSCRTVYGDPGLDYDRANPFAIPQCPQCAAHPVLLVKATFDVELMRADLATAREENARLTADIEKRENAARIQGFNIGWKAGTGAGKASAELEHPDVKQWVDTMCQLSNEAEEEWLKENERLRTQLAAVEADRDALRAWKTEAMAVLTEDDNLARGYVNDFITGGYGQSVVRLVVEDARALRTQLAAATGEIEQPGGWREMVHVANAKIGELEQQLAALRTERGR